MLLQQPDKVQWVKVIDQEELETYHPEWWKLFKKKSSQIEHARRKRKIDRIESISVDITEYESSIPLIKID